MATYVKGDAVANATSYELFENVNGEYNSLATANAINFEVSALGLEAGEHKLVVKAKADGYEDSNYSNEVVYNIEESQGEDTNAVFDFDFATNTINDYALSDIFTVPDGSNVSGITYDATYGMNLNNSLPNGLSLVNPLDASKPWTLEFTALFVTPTVLAGNRRAFLGGADLYPFVFINGNTYDQMGFQISNGNHATVGYGKLVYDKECDYKIVYDGNGKVTAYADGVEIGSGSVNFTGQSFVVILGNVKGKSSAYTWQDVETGKKSYLHKLKFYYN